MNVSTMAILSGKMTKSDIIKIDEKIRQIWKFIPQISFTGGI